MPALRRDRHRLLTSMDTTRTLTPAFFQQLTHQWMEAWLKQDYPALESLLSEKFFMVNRRARNLHSDRSQWLQMARQQGISAFRLEFVQINICGQTAVVLYRFWVVSSPHLNPDYVPYLVTDTWAHCEGGWKALCRQVTALD
jgi:hypothetical protein